MPTANLYFDDEKVWVVAFCDYKAGTWVETSAGGDGATLAGLVRDAWDGYRRSETAYEDIDWVAAHESYEPVRQAFEVESEIRDIRLVYLIRNEASRWDPAEIRVLGSERKGEERVRSEAIVLPFDADDVVLGAAIRQAMDATT